MHTPTGNFTTVSVASHACEVYQPSQLNPHGFTVLYLHDHQADSLAAWFDFLRICDQHGWRVIAPQTGPCWWADRVCPQFDAKITPERFVVKHVLAWLADQWQVRPPQIAIVGRGMGGQGALKLGFKHPERFPVVAAVRPAIDFQQLVYEGDEVLYAMYGDPETARQDTATLHVHPLNWVRNLFFASDPADPLWHEGGERLRMKLSALGIPFTCDLETSTANDRAAYDAKMAERIGAFLAAGLESERLRVG